MASQASLNAGNDGLVSQAAPNWLSGTQAKGLPPLPFSLKVVYPDSVLQYIRDWEVTGLLAEADAAGHAVFTLKNRFYPGDTLELVQPGKAPYTFTAQDITDDDGNLLPVVHHPEMRFHLTFPFAVQPCAILRHARKNELTIGQNIIKKVCNID